MSGTHVLEIPYPEQLIVFQVGISHEAVFFSSTSGIHEVGQIDPLQQIHQIHQGNIRGLPISTDCLVYVDGDTQQVKMINRHSLEISHIAGSGRQATQDGSSKTASFAQPMIDMILCREGRTLFLTDLAAAKVVMIIPMDGTQAFLRSLNELTDSIGIPYERKKDKAFF